MNTPTTTSSTDFYKAEKDKAIAELAEKEKQIADIEKEAEHKTWGLKFDAATLRKKLKALDTQINTK